jgi:hypothetical protein
MNDGSVRPEHAANEGVIKPINQWTQIPPLDYNCRCTLEQTDEEPNGRDITVKNDTVATNAAVGGSIFIKKQSYFGTVKKLPEEEKHQIEKSTEAMKEYMPYSNVIKMKNGRNVFINDYAHAEELEDNTATAKILVENHDMDVKIPPHTDGHILVGKTNPEFYFKNARADAKRIKGYNGISRGFKSAKDQSCDYVIIDFNKHFDTKKRLDVQKIANKIRNRRTDFEKNEIKGCYVVFGDKSAYVGKEIFIKSLTGNELSDKIREVVKVLNPN